MKNKAIKNAIKKMFGVGITTDYFNAIAKQRLPANTQGSALSTSRG